MGKNIPDTPRECGVCPASGAGICGGDIQFVLTQTDKKGFRRCFLERNGGLHSGETGKETAEA